MPAQQNTLKPANIATVLGASVLGGAAYGAATGWLPFLKFDAMVLLGTLIIIAILHAALRHALVVNLGVALVSAALSVFAMWAVWYGARYGFGALGQVLASGPKGIPETLRQLGMNTSYRVRTGQVTATHSPDEVRLFWWIETIAFVVTPLLGAISSVWVKRRAARLRQA